MTAPGAARKLNQAQFKRLAFGAGGPGRCAVVSMDKTFHVTNFGCRASQSEGASIHRNLLDANAAESASPYAASVVIVNSCTVTAEADRDVRQTDPAHRITQSGSTDYRHRLLCPARSRRTRRPCRNVRYVVGNSHKPLVGQLALNVFDEDFSQARPRRDLLQHIFLERELKPASHRDPAAARAPSSRFRTDATPIARSASFHRCAGAAAASNPILALAEIRDLVVRGYKEIVFSGIHLGTYGRDLRTKVSFMNWCAASSKFPDWRAVRLSSIEPLEVAPELIDLVADASADGPPLSYSASKRIGPDSSRDVPAILAGVLLRAGLAHSCAHSRRRHRRGRDGRFSGRNRRRLHCDLSSDRTVALTYLHVFPYSSRPGTVAAGLPESGARPRFPISGESPSRL